jgi:hypothetical protein
MNGSFLRNWKVLGLSLILLSFDSLIGCVSVKLPPKPVDPVGSQITFMMPRPGSFIFYVQGIVNGIPKTFVLDTGAANTSLAKDDQTQNFQSIQKINGCDQVMTNHFQAAGVQRAGMRLLRCPTEVNTLGIDMLYNLVVSFSFTRATFASIPTLPINQIALPLRRSGTRQIEVPAQIASIPTLALFDTGSEYTVIDRNFVNAHTEFFKPGPVDSVMVTDFMGNKNESRLFQLKETLKIGNLEFKDQLIAAFPFSQSLKSQMDNAIVILGTSTIAAADWFFDLKTNMWTGNLRTH